ncbi:MAG: hypothetical protein A2W93_10405 [Bacteroidetes bacterium GWF2_43_63]|nr:MAG: hypothetical protein A2W94_02065 [Bacteroidetes bacterium GWE2_42_42]OFY52932.1 MAG: hypothetical protein A2W93_10405 [Bacteroidetes bacterium GWF2_43_63]HBG70140.1 hypothetical protein [Bacteroidales bacterium]HCB62253.1 hypothetical protein [Bacteroidales bacterium]
MLNILFLTNRFYEYLYVVAISTYKFLFAGPVAVASGFNYWEISLCLALGGIIGFIVFYCFSAEIILVFNRLFQRGVKTPRTGWIKRYRRQVRLRKLGFPMLMIFGPAILSIPLTAFIVRRWFRNTKYIFVYFCVSVVSWAFIFGTLAWLNIV